MKKISENNIKSKSCLTKNFWVCTQQAQKNLFFRFFMFCNAISYTNVVIWFFFWGRLGAYLENVLVDISAGTCFRRTKIDQVEDIYLLSRHLKFFFITGHPAQYIGHWTLCVDFKKWHQKIIFQKFPMCASCVQLKK